MRSTTFVLAVLGLLSIGTVAAVAGDRFSSPAAATYLTVATDAPAAVTPVHWYGYGPARGWYGYYYGPRPYYTYRPYVDEYAPRYYQYYPDVTPGYDYYINPYGFGFQYYGPRRSFSFGF